MFTEWSESLLHVRSRRYVRENLGAENIDLRNAVIYHRDTLALCRAYGCWQFGLVRCCKNKTGFGTFSLGQMWPLRFNIVVSALLFSSLIGNTFWRRIFDPKKDISVIENTYEKLPELHFLLQNLAATWVAFLLRIRKVPCSNLEPYTGHPDWSFSCFFPVPPGKFRHQATTDPFEKYPFEFIIYPSSYHSTPYVVVK
jgi:hypothetical protein